jgi:hypothetical protein
MENYIGPFRTRQEFLDSINDVSGLVRRLVILFRFRLWKRAEELALFCKYLDIYTEAEEYSVLKRKASMLLDEALYNLYFGNPKDHQPEE